MEKILEEIKKYLNPISSLSESPIPFPRFVLKQRFGSGEWFEKYLLKKDPLTKDITAEVSWDDHAKMLTLPMGDLKKGKLVGIYGMLLLSDDQLDELCSPGVFDIRPNQGLTLSIRITRTSHFCCWDKLFSQLLLSTSPFYLPPFFESRKMIWLSIACVSIDKTTPQKVELDFAALHPVLKEATFQPGYLIPLVNIKEKLTLTPRFLDHNDYQYIFHDMDETNIIFLVGYPENGDPFIIHPHEIKSKKFNNPKKILSYTIISRPGSNRAEDNDMHPAILQELNVINQIRDNLKPRGSFFNHYLSAIPSRGDLRHLLAQLPLSGSGSMGLEIEKFSYLKLKSSDSVFLNYQKIEPLKNYGWFLHETTDPAIALSEAYQPLFIVISFSCKNEQSSIFHENILDYACTFLNQHVWGPYRIINSQLGERLTRESNNHAASDSR
jgi:hypothetical protein